MLPLPGPQMAGHALLSRSTGSGCRRGLLAGSGILGHMPDTSPDAASGRSGTACLPPARRAPIIATRWASRRGSLPSGLRSWCGKPSTVVDCWRSVRGRGRMPRSSPSTALRCWPQTCHCRWWPAAGTRASTRECSISPSLVVLPRAVLLRPCLLGQCLPAAASSAAWASAARLAAPHRSAAFISLGRHVVGEGSWAIPVAHAAPTGLTTGPCAGTRAAWAAARC
jgi:hypothetical protein